MVDIPRFVSNGPTFVSDPISKMKTIVWNSALRIATSVAAVACLCAAAHAAPRPNIVVLFADDMGYSDIGSFGSEIETPNLDGLAANGVRFSHFYNTGRCCPSRA